MAKMESSFKNMTIVLVTITFISGLVLGGVNHITIDAIQLSKALKQQEAIKLVAPEYDNDPIAETDTISMPDGTKAIVFPAKKANQFVGAAVSAVSNNGFGGPINIMVGFDQTGNILEYTVLSHSETPGLGSKMPQWFHEKGSIIGKNPYDNKLTVSKDGGEIDAITAATISSRAFLNAVANAYSAYMDRDIATGATSINKEE